MSRRFACRVALPLVLAGTAACALARPESVYLDRVQAPGGEARTLDASMRQFAREGFSGAVLVARGPRVVLYSGYGAANRARELPNTAETRYPYGALTRVFTAAAILGLEAEGKLRLDQRAADWLGDSAGDATIRELLYRTGESRAADPGPVHAVAFGGGPNDQEAPVTVGPSYALLEQVVEAAGGEPVLEAFRRKQFGPAGMRRTFVDDGRLDDSLVARGYTAPFGATVVVTGLVGPLGDLFRWHQALRMETFLPLAARQRMETPGANGDAMGWTVGRTADGIPVIEHASDQAGFQLWYGYFPGEDLLILVAANSDDGFRRPVAERLTSLLLGPGAPGAAVSVTRKQGVGGH